MKPLSSGYPPYIELVTQWVITMFNIHTIVPIKPALVVRTITNVPIVLIMVSVPNGTDIIVYSGNNTWNVKLSIGLQHGVIVRV